MAAATKKPEAAEATEETTTEPIPFRIIAEGEEAFKPAANQPAIGMALWNIINELPDLQESGEYKIQGSAIKYVPTAEIMRAAKPLLLKYGVLVKPKVLTSHTKRDYARAVNPDGKEIFDGRPQGIRVHRVLEVEFTFTSVADGSFFEATAEGEGFDTNSDKATRKAHASALRSALFVVYQLTTHEDEPGAIPEADPQKDRAAQQREAARGAAQGGVTKPAPATKPAAQPTAAKPAGAATQEAAAVVAESDRPTEAPAPEVAPAEGPAAGGTENLVKNPAPDVDNLDGLKQEIQALNLELGVALGKGDGKPGLERIEADALMEQLVKVGIKRADWINKPTYLRKLRDELGRQVTEAKAGPADTAGTE